MATARGPCARVPEGRGYRLLRFCASEFAFPRRLSRLIEGAHMLVPLRLDEPGVWWPRKIFQSDQGRCGVRALGPASHWSENHLPRDELVFVRDARYDPPHRSLFFAAEFIPHGVEAPARSPTPIDY
jgi:hypothetical protein